MSDSIEGFQFQKMPPNFEIPARSLAPYCTIHSVDEMNELQFKLPLVRSSSLWSLVRKSRVFHEGRLVLSVTILRQTNPSNSAIAEGLHLGCGCSHLVYQYLFPCVFVTAISHHSCILDEPRIGVCVKDNLSRGQRARRWWANTSEWVDGIVWLRVDAQSAHEACGAHSTGGLLLHPSFASSWGLVMFSVMWVRNCLDPASVGCLLGGFV